MGIKRGLSVTLVVFVLLCVATAAPAEITRQVYLMGTRCVLTTYVTDSLKGQQQLETFIQILEGAEQELSVWRPDTVFSRINAHPVGQGFPLEAHLFALLKELAYWRNYTQGTFDPAIGSLLHAWGLYGRGAIPSDDALKAALTASGMAHIEFWPATNAILRREDVLLDSGAFGKGEGLDRVFQQSVKVDGAAWLIDLGGQIMVRGSRPDGSCWPVRVAHPRHRERGVLALALCSGSIATSGGSERDLQTGGRRIGHILDPRTGLPASFEGSVTVWNQRGLVADILSTALYVMGPEDGFAWAIAKDIAACFLIPAGDGTLKVRITPAFAQRFGGLPAVL